MTEILYRITCDRCGCLISTGDYDGSANLDDLAPASRNLTKCDMCNSCYRKYQNMWNQFMQPDISEMKFEPNETKMFHHNLL